MAAWYSWFLRYCDPRKGFEDFCGYGVDARQEGGDSLGVRRVLGEEAPQVLFLELNHRQVDQQEDQRKKNAR